MITNEEIKLAAEQSADGLTNDGHTERIEHIAGFESGVKWVTNNGIPDQLKKLHSDLKGLSAHYVEWETLAAKHKKYGNAKEHADRRDTLDSIINDIEMVLKGQYPD